MAAVLAVVRPHMNGIGGDAFLLIREGRSGRVHALNGSGRVRQLAATPAAFRARGYDAMPTPASLRDGAGRGARVVRRAAPPRHHLAGGGTAPAIGYAEPRVSRFREAGRRHRCGTRSDRGRPGHGRRVPAGRRAAGSRARAAPAGPRAQPASCSRAAAPTRSTPASSPHASTASWPRSTDSSPPPTWPHTHRRGRSRSPTYQGHRVLQFPPNTQGVALLMQMNMAELFDLRSLGHNTPDYVHTLVEIKKLAFAERDRHITDPAFAETARSHAGRALLSVEHAASALLEPSGAHHAARHPTPSARHDGDVHCRRRRRHRVPGRRRRAGQCRLA
jgi:hypothetical protein